MYKSYRFLFPFEKVPQNSKIIIYGAGVMGQEYLTQLTITNYCEIIGFVDKNYKNYIDTRVPVYSPDDIGKLSFDYVVVALRISIAYNEIKRVLKEAGVSEDRIIAVYMREYDDCLLRDFNVEDLQFSLSYDDCPKSIAILLTGGYGDLVIQKRIIMEIIKLVPDCRIDFYSIRYIDFIRHLYSDINNVRYVIADLGVRYKTVNNRYSLSMTIEACHFISVDYFNDLRWNNDKEFSQKINCLIRNTKLEGETIATPVYLSECRRLYKGYNAYSGFNYDGVFNVCDNHVSIPLVKEVEERFKSTYKSWKCAKYITINCGNGECLDSSKVAKTWPVSYYEKLVLYIKKYDTSIKIIQLGGENAVLLSGVDEYVVGKDFPFVEYVLKNSYLHIDIEGGLVHIASQLGTKCVVLFGPTSMEYYGYEKNINIRAGNCHNCWGLYTDVNKCARGLKEPECMYSITPEIVYKHVKEELDKR